MREKDPRQFFPFEWTPLYVGSPPLHGTPGSSLPKVGGGYIEPIGFNAPPPARVEAGARPSEAAARARPDWLVPLSSWAGVASGWMAQNSKPQVWGGVEDLGGLGGVAFA